MTQQWRIHLPSRRYGFDSWGRKIPWRRKRQATPVFLPGKSHGQRSLVGYRPRGRRESNMTQQLDSSHVARLFKVISPVSLNTWVGEDLLDDYIAASYLQHWASLVAQLVKNWPAKWETWVWSLGWEDPLEKGKATHSSILAWRIPWTIQLQKARYQMASSIKCPFLWRLEGPACLLVATKQTVDAYWGLPPQQACPTQSQVQASPQHPQVLLNVLFSQSSAVQLRNVLSLVREEATWAREFKPFDLSIKRTEISTCQQFLCFWLLHFSVNPSRKLPRTTVRTSRSSLPWGSLGQGHIALGWVIPNSKLPLSFALWFLLWSVGLSRCVV